MGADTIINAVVGTGTLGAGVGDATTLGNDVVSGDTLGDKSDGYSGEVVRGGEDGSVRTAIGKVKALRRTLDILSIALDVSSPNVRKGAVGLDSLRIAMMSPMDWNR